MAATFCALLATKDGNRQSVAVTELTETDLMDGEVTVAVEHSTVNYKDGLAITGKAPIIRKFPLIPGVDWLVGCCVRRGPSLPSGRLRRGERLWTWRGTPRRLLRAGPHDGSRKTGRRAIFGGRNPHRKDQRSGGHRSLRTGHCF